MAVTARALTKSCGRRRMSKEGIGEKGRETQEKSEEGLVGGDRRPSKMKISAYTIEILSKCSGIQWNHQKKHWNTPKARVKIRLGDTTVHIIRYNRNPVRGAINHAIRKEVESTEVH